MSLVPILYCVLTGYIDCACFLTSIEPVRLNWNRLLQTHPFFLSIRWVLYDSFSSFAFQWTARVRCWRPSFENRRTKTKAPCYSRFVEINVWSTAIFLATGHSKEFELFPRDQYSTFTISVCSSQSDRPRNCRTCIKLWLFNIVLLSSNHFWNYKENESPLLLPPTFAPDMRRWSLLRG